MARVVYFADGKPQGLMAYQSESTGVANIAGRYAAAMGLAYQTWKDDPKEAEFAARCLKAGREVYEMGRALEGVQQGNSYKAPYRYEEGTWADDMEWGAAELARATGEASVRRRGHALRGTGRDREGWMGKEQTNHYQYYPISTRGTSGCTTLLTKSSRRSWPGSIVIRSSFAWRRGREIHFG